MKKIKANKNIKIEDSFFVTTYIKIGESIINIYHISFWNNKVFNL